MEEKMFTALSSLQAVSADNIAQGASSIKIDNTNDSPQDALLAEQVHAINEVEVAEWFINKEYLNQLDSKTVQKNSESDFNYNSLRFFQLEKIVYTQGENPSDKLLSVYHATLRFCQNVIFLIRGSASCAEIYLGISSQQLADTAGQILNSTYLANFPGSTMTPLDADKTQKALSLHICKNPFVSVLSTIPALRTPQSNPKMFTQGIEAFIDTMRGHDYLCELIASPLSDDTLTQRKQGLEQLYSALYPYSKRTMSHGHNNGVTMTTGVSESISHSISQGISLSCGSSKTTAEGSTEGTNIGTSMIVSLGFNNSISETYTSGKDNTRTTDTHQDDGRTITTQKAESTTTTATDNLTIELKNRSIDATLEVLDKHIKRMEDGYSYGMWECAAYFIAPSVAECAMAASAFKALMAGDDSGIERSHVNYFKPTDAGVEFILNSLKYGQHPQFLIPNQLQTDETLTLRPTSLINGRELPLFLGLPRKSVNGVNVLPMVAFGRNILADKESSNNKISIGYIQHMGDEKQDIPTILDAELLTSHCFITGSTGSGKSNAVYQMIDCLTDSQQNKNVPFLVIEPAKGEYRQEFKYLENIQIFTTNPFQEQLLKLNPFYFPPQIHVLEHLDRLIEIFNACWEMYAAMPAILKDALERAYVHKGWDMINSIHRSPQMPEYPTFLDVLDQLPIVINESGYSADTKGDYKGALITRVKSLTNGIYGQIFCDDVEIDEKTLFDSRTIVDLSRVGSAETKALIMGILILKLSEYRMATAKQSNQPLKHITILEEAHHLLKNTQTIRSTAGNNLIAKSVEMISASIAEMRTYGEGFIIVDQSPTSVDISAIKNTNTKIIMRLPEKDDCNLAGRSLALSEEQTAELSRLKTGNAVVMQSNWSEAVLCRINLRSRPDSENLGISYATNYDTIRRFRGAVATAVVDTLIQQNGSDVEPILKQIEKFDITIAKKLEMKRYIDHLARKLDILKTSVDRRGRQKVIGQSITKILGFEEAFRMAEKELVSTDKQIYTPESIQRWRDILVDQLLQLVENESPTQKRMFQYMLFAQDVSAKKIDYQYLYSQIYVR